MSNSLVIGGLDCSIVSPVEAGGGTGGVPSILIKELLDIYVNFPG